MPKTSRKIVLAGGSGFLGQLLANWFHQSNWEVVVLTRKPAKTLGPARAVAWDGKTLGDWASELNDSTVLVNLAGLSVNCRYHARNRQAILTSRVDSTRVLGEAVRACVHSPQVWLNSSTATIYKHTYDQPMDEKSGVIAGSPEAKDVFSVDVATAWEQTFNEAVTPQTRKVAMRTAMVFSTQPGTVFRILRRLARLGLGGAMDDGRQYVSWIHQTDFCRAIEWLIARENFAGTVNVASPQPLPNHEMMRIIRQACRMPIGLPAKRWMLEVGALVLRTETELIIKSRRVVPARLIEAGFQFHFPDMVSAVKDLQQRLASKEPLRLDGHDKGETSPCSKIHCEKV